MELNNNVSSLNSSMRMVDLLAAFVGPVQNLMVLATTNQTADLSWEPPLESNGILSGYSVYTNDSVVSDIIIQIAVLSLIFVHRY